MLSKNFRLSPASNPKSSSISQSDDPMVTERPLKNSETTQTGTGPIDDVSSSI